MFYVCWLHELLTSSILKKSQILLITFAIFLDSIAISSSFDEISSTHRTIELSFFSINGLLHASFTSYVMSEPKISNKGIIQRFFTYSMVTILIFELGDNAFRNFH